MRGKQADEGEEGQKPMGSLRTPVPPRLSQTHPVVGQAADSPRSLETLLLSEAPWVHVLLHMYLIHVFEASMNLDQTQMIVQLMQKLHFSNRTGSR